MLQNQFELIATLAKSRYPNLRLAYLSSRIYAGYAQTALNPEPYAYESGFSVKWLIERQLLDHLSRIRRDGVSTATLRIYDSIGGDSPGLLEVLDRTLGLRPKEAVERSRIVC